MELTFAERLRLVAKRAGGTAALADLTGIPKRSLDAYIGEESDVPGERLRKIVAATGVDAGWLLIGVGRAPGTEAALYLHEHETTVLTTDGQPPAHVARLTERLVEVPLYRNLLSAGNGIMALDDEVIGTRSFDRQWINDDLGVPVAMLALAIARGDSMQPTLYSGDIVLIDKRDTGPMRDDIYAVLLDGEVYVKRLQRGLDGSLDVISDNKEHYKTLTLNSDSMNQREFGILGRVVWWAHTNAD